MTDTLAAPCLLAAMPQLADENFLRSVVLLVEHSDEGSTGLVLNRPGDLSVGQLCHSLEIDWSKDREMETDWGGPVQPNTAWMLISHLPDAPFPVAGQELERVGARSDSGTEDTKKLMDGLYFGYTLATLREIANGPPAQFRLFLGYSGWGPGQLEGEIARGDWLVAPASPQAVFDTEHESLWAGVFRSIGVDPTHLMSSPGVH